MACPLHPGRRRQWASDPNYVEVNKRNSVNQVISQPGALGKERLAVTVENEDNPQSRRWRSTIDALAASLAAHLGEQVTVVNASEIEDAFSCLIRGPKPSGPTLQLAWEGVLGMEHIDGKPDISVSLFLYSRGRRLRLDDQRGSYLELVYQGPLDGQGTWRDLGWLPDDLGEFEAHDHYGG